MKYMAMRVEDMPVNPVPSVKRQCSKCEKEVWIQEGMAEIADKNEIVCQQCLTTAGG